MKTFWNANLRNVTLQLCSYFALKVWQVHEIHTSDPNTTCLQIMYCISRRYSGNRIREIKPIAGRDLVFKYTTFENFRFYMFSTKMDYIVIAENFPLQTTRLWSMKHISNIKRKQWKETLLLLILQANTATLRVLPKNFIWRLAKISVPALDAFFLLIKIAKNKVLRN